MSEGKIAGIMQVTLEKIKSMVDAETVIGDPIHLDEVSIIPVSKVSFGLATGGSDFSSKTATNGQLFGGGGGAGVSISPIAFIVVKGEDVRMLQIHNESSTADKAIAMVPELIDKIKSLFKKEPKKNPVIFED